MRVSRGRTSATGQAGPFLKWAGGKGQLLGQLDRLFPDLNGRGYVEPFMGSGAVFFHVVQNYAPSHCTLLDINPELVNAFRRVRDNVGELIARLEAHDAKHNGQDVSPEQRKEYYYDIRQQEPEPESIESAARFIYLNRTCFNGLHRLNSKGKFNVPIGDYKNPRILDADNLRRVSALLQGVTLQTASFRESERLV
jgi:DNA adenine methylase